jgi:hypothetical protein
MKSGKRMSCRGSFRREGSALLFSPSGVNERLVRDYYECSTGPVRFRVEFTDEYEG